MNKKIKIIFSVIVGIVVSYVIVWNIYVNTTFRPYVNKLGGIWNGSMYVLEEEDYTYSVVFPKFPNVVGNLAVTHNLIIKEDEEVEDTVDILIWLMPGNKKEIGISVETSGESQDEYHIERMEEDFYVDSMMQLIQPADEHTRQIYQDNYSEIQNLFNRVYQKWGILTPRR